MTLTKNKTILIIDDDEMLRIALCELVRGEGFEVTCCDNGLAAVDLAKEKCFDAIITDYNMPGMNGVEVTKVLSVQCPDSFIIALTSASREMEFLGAGADAFFYKPFSIKDVITLIKSMHK